MRVHVRGGVALVEFEGGAVVGFARADQRGKVGKADEFLYVVKIPGIIRT